MSSLFRGHANLLCMIPILVYVLPKWALNSIIFVLCLSLTLFDFLNTLVYMGTFECPNSPKKLILQVFLPSFRQCILCLNYNFCPRWLLVNSPCKVLKQCSLLFYPEWVLSLKLLKNICHILSYFLVFYFIFQKCWYHTTMIISLCSHLPFQKISALQNL